MTLGKRRLYAVLNSFDLIKRTSPLTWTAKDRIDSCYRDAASLCLHKRDEIVHWRQSQTVRMMDFIGSRMNTSGRFLALPVTCMNR